MLFFTDNQAAIAPADTKYLLVRDGYLLGDAVPEQHTVALPTKRFNANTDDAYLYDSDFDVWKEASLPAWRELFSFVDEGGTIFWPSAGVGIKEASIYQRAPKIAGAIERNLDALVKKAGAKQRHPQRLGHSPTRKEDGSWDIHATLPVGRCVLTGDTDPEDIYRCVAEIHLSHLRTSCVIATTEGFERIDGIIPKRSQVFREPRYFEDVNECHKFAYDVLGQVLGTSREELLHRFGEDYDC